MSSKASLSSLPPGYAQQYSGGTLENVAIAFMVLETTFVGLRFWAQYIGQRPFGIDDGLMIPAYVFCMIGLALDISKIQPLLGRMIFSANYYSPAAIRVGGVGYHQEVVEILHPEALVPRGKILLTQPFIYACACAFPKLVLLSLYLRIFPHKSQRVACYTLMGLTVAYAASLIIATALQCQPLQFLWDQTVPGLCFDIPAFYRYGSLPNLIFDVCMLVLPLPAVWKLHASRQVKVGLTLTFLTGSIGIITSLVRTVLYFKYDPLQDGTWNSVVFMTWSAIEPGVYIIAACLPCYRPLLRYIQTGDGRSSGKIHSSDFSGPKNLINSFVARRKARVGRDTLASIDEATELETNKTHNDTHSTWSVTTHRNNITVLQEIDVSCMNVGQSNGSMDEADHVYADSRGSVQGHGATIYAGPGLAR